MQQVIPRRGPALGTVAVVLVAVALVAAGSGLALLSSGSQRYILLLLVAGVAAIYVIPRMARKEPTVTVAFLTVAFAVKLIGSLARYVVFEVVYRQGGDAKLYHQAGEAYYQMIRHADLSFLQAPYTGTNFLEYFTGGVYAVTGPTLPGAFLVFAMAAFAGSWFFYRAHRIAFPDGNSRLYRILVFFFPTMVFWPSSLGKDALVVFALGLGCYGLARLLQRVSASALLQLLAGTGFAFAIRPAIGAVFLFGAILGFLIHPGRARTVASRPVAWALLAPLLVGALVLTVRTASVLEGYDLTSQGAEEYYQETIQQAGSGGSAFQVGIPSSPVSAAQSAITVLFRPFPGESESAQAVLAGVESLSLGILVLLSLGPLFRAAKLWRGGMVVSVFLVTVGIVAALAGFSNFGLLARQRAQMLPFFFMLLAAVPWRARRGAAARHATPAGAQPAAAQAAATPGQEPIRPMASATRST
ncbi:MAG: glycosyltransferase family 39 protein [Actinomycetota bacterium]